MPYEITQCYLPPGRGDFPAFTPAEAGTRFSDPGGMQGWVEDFSRRPKCSCGCRLLLQSRWETVADFSLLSWL